VSVAKLLEQVVQCGGEVRAIYTGSGNPEDRYSIIQEQESWKVFYSERGERLDLRFFPTEDEACDYLFWLLARDGTVWHTP
jgi:hypothetical protein